MLSCLCDYDSNGWYYYPPKDFVTFGLKRRKRCCSCGKLINIGDQCVEFDRYRGPITDIEERICGDEIELASWFMCEECGEIFLTLAELGYCHYLGGKIREDLEDYWDMTGFVPVDTNRPI